jgi:hypothetical protein
VHVTAAEPETVAAELVTGPGTELEPVAERPPSALEAAAEAALAAPGAAGHDEFWALAAQARILAMSGAAPRAVRQDPHLALHLALVGRDLGISPSASLELIDVIKVRDGEYRLSLSPQLMNGQLRRLGLGMILPAERTALVCTAVAFGPAGPDRRCIKTGVVSHVDDCACDVLGTSEFTWEDARIAELVGPNCQPGQLVKDQSRSSSGRSWKVCGCNQGYITYPKRMLWWRASGFAGDDYFPEAGLGLYSAEALGASVDEHGRPIDVDSVELPPGYEPPAVGAGQNGGAPAPAAEQLADLDELWSLQERLHALPEGHQQDLREKWIAEDSRLRGFPAHALPRSKLKIAQAMVNAFWGRAKGASIDMDAELLNVRRTVFVKVWLTMVVSWSGSLPEKPQEAPEPEPAPETPPEPETASGEPQEPDAVTAAWATQLSAMADEVRSLRQGVPTDVADKIGAVAQNMHWKRINDAIAAANGTTAFPPDSPIDLRRMAVCAFMLESFRATGAMPEEES